MSAFDRVVEAFLPYRKEPLVDVYAPIVLAELMPGWELRPCWVVVKAKDERAVFVPYQEHNALYDANAESLMTRCELVQPTAGRLWLTMCRGKCFARRLCLRRGDETLDVASAVYGYGAGQPLPLVLQHWQIGGPGGRPRMYRACTLYRRALDMYSIYKGDALQYWKKVPDFVKLVRTGLIQ